MTPKGDHNNRQVKETTGRKIKKGLFPLRITQRTGGARALVETKANNLHSSTRHRINIIKLYGQETSVLLRPSFLLKTNNVFTLSSFAT
jgi:hypothetical protein